MERIIQALCVLSVWLFCDGQTIGGNSRGAPCFFPFIYRGMVYTSCIMLEADAPWCATTEDYDKDKYWGSCVGEDLDNLPSFEVSTPQNVTVYQGETARLMCTVKNLQGKKVSWQIKGAQYPLTVSTFSFVSNGRYKVEHHEDAEWNLLITNSKRSDSSIYQCRVTTQTMMLVREVHLTVLDKVPTATPAVTLGEQTTIYVEKGKELILQCNASSTASTSASTASDTRVIPPEVEWFKDGNKIDSHVLNNIMITNQIHESLRISTLTVDKTLMDDAGIYVCRTTDKTTAEVAVRILNVDKDNKKRGTASEAVPAGIRQDSDDSTSSACCPLASLTIIYILVIQLT